MASGAQVANVKAGGLAYGTRHDEHLLNVPAGKMSGFPDQPGDFLDYLLEADAFPQMAHEVLAQAFVPRLHCAGYLRQRLQQAVSASAAQLEIRAARVVAMERQADGVMLQLDTGQPLLAARVALCTGNALRPLPARGAGAVPPDKRVEAWDFEAVHGIAAHADVAIVGSGLSMADSVASLAACGHRGQVHVLSRHALLPLPHALPLLESGADLFLAGENRGGINGADKLLAPYGEKPIKRDSARRCSLYHGTLDKPVVPFELDAWFSRYECQAGDTTLTVMALPGVFSADGLDLGTQMLLASLPPVTGKLLDFGCGAGVIGSVLAKRNPALAVTMVDINALALESSRRTLAVNGLSGRVHASDVYSDIAETFQQIVSNPPFHAGLKTFYAATETFLAKAPEYLTANGALTIVANAFLRYQPILDAHFKQTEVIAGDAKFKVYLSKA